uniref:histidine kinase n=1 Tax=termite gut metagenome TaxID=433724 RepID=S0DDM1_9ZZZZ
MAIKILLVVSVLLQLFATVIAIRMIRKTKFNSVWILFIVALLLMTASRVLQFVHFAPQGESSPWFIALIWIGIATSLCLTVVLFNARRLVDYIDRLIFQRTLTSKRILSTTLRTEEKERIRFSKELHDGLGPLLSSAKMSLSALSTEGRTESDREIIGNTAYVIDEAIRSLREISNNLSPHVLNEFGLGRGVGNYISRCAAIHDIRIDYRTNMRGERFDADVEVILYRVICELLGNSLKHSGASEVALELNFDTGAITLDYSDNGCGFNPQADGGLGMGLANITSRINTLNGRLDIRSAKGEGMNAHVKIDLDREG